jgi:hypothetical protein
MIIPEVILAPNNGERKLYFDNNKVEHLLCRYGWTGCTEVALRDEIMSHAGELIRKVILIQGFQRIYSGQDSGFMDLIHVAWIQIERTLYKYKARVHCADCYNPGNLAPPIIYEPGEYEYGILTPEEIGERNLICPSCGKVPGRIAYRGTSKVFNLWTQITRTVILAYIKTNSRDLKCQQPYSRHLGRREVREDGRFARFIQEAEEVAKHDKDFLVVLEAVKGLAASDDSPGDGLIRKLIARSGLPRSHVIRFLKMVRMRGDCFTDSPLNRRPGLRVERVEGADPA